MTGRDSPCPDPGLEGDMSQEAIPVTACLRRLTRLTEGQRQTQGDGSGRREQSDRC